ncbi:MAG: hypothetical protein WBA41_14275 [Rivularia sp. (in: cyanobacteria)]
MSQNTSCLLALALAVSSALVAIPSQAQTATETNKDKTASSQSSVSNDLRSNLKKSRSVNQNKAINISQSQPSSTTANTQKTERVRIPLYSRIGFGLKQ